jgi:hypothetical protein
MKMDLLFFPGALHALADVGRRFSRADDALLSPGRGIYVIHVYAIGISKSTV